MKNLAITTAFAAGCFWIASSSVHAQLKVAKAGNDTAALPTQGNGAQAKGAKANPKSLRPNLSKQPAPSMQVGTGKAATTLANGQKPNTGAANLNPGVNRIDAYPMMSYPNMNRGGYPGMYPNSYPGAYQNNYPNAYPGMYSNAYPGMMYPNAYPGRYPSGFYPGY